MGYFTKNMENTTYATSEIRQAFNNNTGSSSRVYFGKYKGKKLRWRVMQSGVTGFDAHSDEPTMYLDMLEVVEEMAFTEDTKTDKNYAWSHSMVRSFLSKDFPKEFTEAELSIVPECLTNPSGKYAEYEKLEYDRFFVPSSDEFFDSEHNFYICHKHFGDDYHKQYWLRSCDRAPSYAEIISVNLFNTEKAEWSNTYKENKFIGVSPACNIKKTNILFSSKIADRTFKFTIIGSSSINFDSKNKNKASIKDGKVSIPYCANGDNNAISVMILDEKYSGGLNKSGASLLLYENLKSPKDYSKGGVVSFTLPENLDFNDWDEKYHVYLLAEKWNEEDETDYASYPCEIPAAAVSDNTCTVSYYTTRDNKEPYATQIVVSGRCTVAPADPVSDTHYFNSWVYMYDGKKFDFSKQVTEDISLLATWDKIPEYNIWVGGVQINQRNSSDVLGDGMVHYDRDSKTLSFADATITKSRYHQIVADFMLITDEDLTIKGKVKFDNKNAYGGIIVRKGATLTLSDDISINAKEMGIFTQNAKEINLSDANLEISGTTYGFILGGEGSISTIMNMKGGTLKIESKEAGLYAVKNGEIIIDPLLMIKNPPDGKMGNAIFVNSQVTTVVDEDGNMAKDITISAAPAPRDLIAELITENGLERRSGRYNVTYTAEEIEPKVVVKDRKNSYVTLREGIDYTLSYSNNINVSKEDKPAVVTITYKGNYKGADRLYFYILPKYIGYGTKPSEGITLYDVMAPIGDKDGKIYVVMYYNGHKLTSRDYDLTSNIGKLTFTENDAKQNIRLTISGKGNYAGAISGVILNLLSNAEADNQKIMAHFAYTYDGMPKELDPDMLSIKDGNGNILPKDKFTILYEDNINVGLAKARVTALTGSGYYGDSTLYFDILPDVNKSVVKAEITEKVYYKPGGVRPPVKVTATLGKTSKILEEGKDYTVDYMDNNKATKTARYMVIFKGNYEGRASIRGTFVIEKAQFDQLNVSAIAADLPYTGPGQYLSKVYVTADGKLIDQSSYTVNYFVGDKNITKDKKFSLSDKEKEASVSLVLKGKGNYALNLVRINNCYTIKKLSGDDVIDLSKAVIGEEGSKKLNISSKTYTGDDIVPRLQLNVPGVGKDYVPASKRGLKEKEDYEFVLFDNKDVGTATVFAKSVSSSKKAIGGNYATFKIVPIEP
ncbi:DUF6273 domain-containing protein [Butyrivibrio sp. VCB2006]|uniref:DUF6273 domain-containing protein n=1 Tax=Butyrivibrio sp. VCB2006 TaxID=1280679 RepID=UPI000492C958|nr:DUF6273 domain-containing protein [Butyrivibrio sp. VCB2006]